MRFTCPTCNQPMQCPDDYAGKKVSCPSCGQKVMIPAAVKPHLPAAGNKTVLAKFDDEQQLPTAELAPSVIPVQIVESPADPGSTSKRGSRDREHDEPRSRRGRDDDYDDDYEDRTSRRSGRRRRRCPECGSTERPRQTTKFGTMSIVLLIVGIFFWPLLIVAFFVQEKWDVCIDCGQMLEQTGTGI